MPKLSIIITCCNQGHYIEEAVESIFNQTYQDFEIIIVNNGSNDEFTCNLLYQFYKTKTKIIHTEKKELALARDEGIKEASGKYILPLNVDDKIEKEYLEEIVKILDINVREYNSIIKEKNTHIRNIESELNRIKQSKAWRLAEMFRRIFYVKLLGKIPLLQRSVLNFSKGGFGKIIGRNILTKFGLIENEYDKWIKKNSLTDDRIEGIKREGIEFQYRPKISIIMPVYNVDESQ